MRKKIVTNTAYKYLLNTLLLASSIHCPPWFCKKIRQISFIYWRKCPKWCCSWVRKHCDWMRNYYSQVWKCLSRYWKYCTRACKHYSLVRTQCSWVRTCFCCARKHCCCVRKHQLQPRNYFQFLFFYKKLFYELNSEW